MTTPHSISSGSIEALAAKLDAISDRIEVSCDWRLSSEERQSIAEAANALRTPALPSGEVEAVAWRIRIREGGKTYHTYTERLPFEPDEDCKITILGEPEALFASSPAPQIARDVTNAQPITTEQLDKLQFGRALHQRPAPPFSRWADTIEAASLAISPKGSKELDALAAEVRAGGAAQARLVREALAPFIEALAGVPASINDAAPFARVSNDVRTPGTMNIITFGEIRKLLAVLSPQAQAGPSLQKTQGSPAQAGAAAQGSRPRDFLAWAVKMFGPVAKLRSERLMRFAEEAIELAHAEGMERSTINLITDRVYSLPAGNVGKEIGQAQACLETFAENIGLSSADEAEREWQRVQEIPQEEWTRQHSAKQALGIALPSTEGK